MDADTFQSTYMSSNIDFLQCVDSDYDAYASFYHSEPCPSLASSFLSIDTSHSSVENGRRGSHEPAPLEELSVSSASVTSPITPMGTTPMSMLYSTDIWCNAESHNGWHSHNVDSEAFWPAFDDLSTANCLMNGFSNHDQSSQFQVGYFCPNRSRSLADPPLSRAVFHNTLEAQKSLVSGETTSWPPTLVAAQPPTVEPKATFQNTLPSSPTVNPEPITPFRNDHDSSSLLTSSPLSGGSSSVLASQWDVEDSRFSSDIDTPEIDKTSAATRVLRSSQISATISEDESQHRAVFAKSGVNCEAIIPQNMFPCTFSGCVDKNGRQKRFKRQEHRKRHERTVHGKQEDFPCWVVTGGKICGRSFTRRDNLKSHWIKTHGRKSNNQRNSYVATLDATSKYYDADWRGRLTAEGLPIGHPRWPEIH